MTQLLTTGHPNSWFGHIVAHLYSHPFATIVVVMTLAIMLQGAGLRFGPPRPVAKRFLTGREQAMLVALERVLPDCRIHAQVAMGALLAAAPSSPFRDRRLSDRNAFSQKIVDFVAQDRASGAISALIEVDDWSHVLPRDMARDAMTGRAGYRTIPIPSHARPTVADVRAAVAVLLPSPTPLERARRGDVPTAPPFLPEHPSDVGSRGAHRTLLTASGSSRSRGNHLSCPPICLECDPLNSR